VTVKSWQNSNLLQYLSMHQNSSGISSGEIEIA